MLSKARQKKYFEKRWKEMDLQFKHFLNSQNPEALHRMRIEMKKINAFRFFLPSTGKNTKGLKKIFDHAGLIRAAFINLKLIARYKILAPSFIKKQEQIMVHESARFLQNRSVYEAILKKDRQTITEVLCDSEDKYILRLYKRQLKEIKHLFLKKKWNKQLHTCRKKIKRLIYFYELLNTPFFDKLKLNIFYLHTLQSTIGKWHDEISIKELFKSNTIGNKKIVSRLEKQISKNYGTIRSLSKNFSGKIVRI